jgi:hypothetical protein
MIYKYATTGQQWTALSLAIMVGLCLLLQLFLVSVQTHKGPRRVMLKEMLIVLSGIAPGVHAMRVASGAGASEHQSLDPDVALAYTRGIEITCESVPGSVVQFGSLLRDYEARGTLNKAAVCSVIVSALTTGFAAATISFE